MKKTSILFILILGAVVLFSLSSSAVEYDVDGLPSITITLSHAEPADPTNFIHASALALKEKIEEDSKGKITVVIASGGALGDGDATIQQAMQGNIEIVSSISDGTIASVDRNMLIWSIPYLFNNEYQALHVYHGEFGREMWREFTTKTGLLPLATYSGGFRHFTSDTKPIHSPADLKGQKIRTMQIPAHMELVKALGGTPTPVSWNELYAALQTGVADGQENPISSFVMGNLYEVQDYLVLDGHVWSQEAILVSKIWLDRQPTVYQQIILNAGSYAQEVGQRYVNVMTEIGLSTLPDEMKEIYEPTAEEIQMFREASQAQVAELIKKQIDNPELVDEVIKKAEEALIELGY